MNAQARPTRVLVLGCGSVAQCVVPLLIRDLKLEPSSITIVDFVDNRHRVADSLAKGVKYEIGQVTRENLDSFLSTRVSEGEILLDLAWNIDGPTILEWCRIRGVRYLNTCLLYTSPSPRDRTRSRMPSSA